MTVKRIVLSLIAYCLLMGSIMLPADARTYYGNTHYYHHHYYSHATYLQRHPYQKKALIGAAIGGAAGGLLSSDGRLGHGMVKGALLGGLAGTGYEYLRRKRVFD